MKKYTTEIVTVMGLIGLIMSIFSANPAVAYTGLVVFLMSLTTLTLRNPEDDEN